jgi:hypothetical protein
VLARDAEGIRGTGDTDTQRLQVQIAKDLSRVGGVVHLKLLKSVIVRVVR